VRLAGTVEGRQSAQQQQRIQPKDEDKKASTSVGGLARLRGHALKRIQRPFFGNVGLSRTYCQK
jgi:hypothetical protein